LSFDDWKIEPVSLPAEAWQPERRPWVLESYLASARKRVEFAQSDFQKTQQKLDAARKTVAETKAETVAETKAETKARSAAPPGDPTVAPPAVADQPRAPEAAGTAVADAQLELNVTEAAVAVAQAEYRSVEQRAEAQRASWRESGEVSREAAVAAVRAERQVVVAKARHAAAVAEQARHRAANDQQEAAEKTLQTAREALAKAIAAAEAEVNPTDQYTRLVGALWTPTRFLSSGNDDPKVEFSAHSTGRRTALANWITDRRNPLTARVAANHIWMRHLGQPLVPTVFDFGRKGTPPTHPELLDWLAAELMDSGWSMKHLHRLIVTSAAYRMSSTTAGGEAGMAADPENRYLWRRVPIRLESQVVRDSLLALAGSLDRKMGGPPVLPAEQVTSARRSLYFFHSNNDRNLFLTTFDEALVKDCYRREQSIVPQQALALTNSRLVLEASEQIASRLSQDTVDDAAFIRKAFRMLVGIEPAEAEMAASESAVAAWRRLPGGTAGSARASFVWAMVNHNDFVTLR
jgi:chemotaxis protein histidine kinase CheA